MMHKSLGVPARGLPAESNTHLVTRSAEKSKVSAPYRPTFVATTISARGRSAIARPSAASDLVSP